MPIEKAADAFAGLAELAYRGETYEGIYEAICRTALAVVPGCDHACVMTMRAGERAVCESATDEVARLIDELEWETGEGPCLDSIRSQRFESDPDIARGAAWPRLAEQVLARTPVRGMVGYRIMVGQRKAGALNLFSDTPGALTAEAANMGAILASFASVALAAADARENANGLREALASNREIGQAVGILMATHALTDRQAFDMLRTVSSQLNVRLAEVARRLVAEQGGNGETTSN